MEIFRCSGLFVGSLLLGRCLEGRFLVVSGRFPLRILLVGMLFVRKLFIGKLLVGGWLFGWLFVGHVGGMRTRATS
jgi:hypothetical protein